MHETYVIVNIRLVLVPIIRLRKKEEFPIFLEMVNCSGRKTQAHTHVSI